MFKKQPGDEDPAYNPAYYPLSDTWDNIVFPSVCNTQSYKVFIKIVH